MGFGASVPTAGHGGGFMASPGATTTYGRNSVTSSVPGVVPGVGAGGGGLGKLLEELIRKKTTPAPPPRKPVLGANAAQSRGITRERVTNKKEDPLAERKALDRYEMRLKSAAMSPVGLGPGMIPGMAVDPRKLPPSMLPQNSGIVGPMHSVAQGSIEAAQPGAPPTAQPDAGGGGADPRMAVLSQMLQLMTPPAKGK